jgi:positive regulator of sigma E activity
VLKGKDGPPALVPMGWGFNGFMQSVACSRQSSSDVGLGSRSYCGNLEASELCGEQKVLRLGRKASEW